MEENIDNIKNVIKEYREKNEYFSQKIKQQEDKEKKLNNNTLFKSSTQNNHNFSPFCVTEGKKDRLPTIQERDTENHSMKPNTEERDTETFAMRKLINKENKKKPIIIKNNDNTKNNEANLFFNMEKQIENENTNQDKKIQNKEKDLKITNEINYDDINKANISNTDRKKPIINTLNNNISEENNKNSSPTKSYKTYKSNVKSERSKLNNDELSNTNIEIIEQSLLKSLSNINPIQNNIYKTNNNSNIMKLKHEIYNKKTDKVALYQYITKVWSKKSKIAKSNSRSKINNTNFSTNDITSEEKINTKINNVITQKVRNIRRPISFYKKF